MACDMLSVEGSFLYILWIIHTHKVCYINQKAFKRKQYLNLHKLTFAYISYTN